MASWGAKLFQKQFRILPIRIALISFVLALGKTHLRKGSIRLVFAN